MLDKSRRITEIDVLRGIGILLVILQHCGVPEWLNMPILAFHMPLFFVVSGYLFRSRAAKDYFGAKAIALLVPMVLFEMANLTLDCIPISLGDGYHLNLYRGKRLLAFGAPWFIPALLYAETGIYLLDCSIRKLTEARSIYRILELCTAFLILALGIRHCQIAPFGGNDGNYLPLGCVAFFFVVAGHLIRLYGMGDKLKALPRWGLIVGGCLLIIALCFSSRLNSVVYMYAGKFGSPLAFVLNALLGVAGTALLAFGIRNNPFLEYCGRHSLVIFYLHSFVLTLFRYAFIMLHLLQDSPICRGMIIFALTVPIVMIGCGLVDRYAPWLEGKFSNKTEMA